ncbi:MAG: nitroreductase family deazaflavin-dependent oxidoreductase, partial [Solirubrobacteraceae bacterium]
NLGTMRPGRPLKWLLRAPVALYSAHAGWLLGHRFLLLAHRGRLTGRVYRTVLEVVAWDEVTREVVVMSGFGRGSQWYRNVLATDPIEVRIARLRFAPRVRQLDAEEAARVLAGYEQRNRIAASFLRRVLSKVAGFRYDGSESARRRLVQALPLLAFRPRD